MKIEDICIKDLPDGFTIIHDDDEKPVAAIVNFKYYVYISQLIKQITEYVRGKK